MTLRYLNNLIKDKKGCERGGVDKRVNSVSNVWVLQRKG